jgi:hypothetical protein
MDYWIVSTKERMGDAFPNPWGPMRNMPAGWLGMSALGQNRSSADVCAMSAIHPTAAHKRIFRHFGFVPNPEVASLTFVGALARTGKCFLQWIL